MHIATPLLAAALLAASTATLAAPATEILPSGVKIEHLKLGEGDSPTASSQVMVHYRGTLLNGTEFDSSHKRGQPASFVLNQVIPCWTQGVQKMKVGGTA